MNTEARRTNSGWKIVTLGDVAALQRSTIQPEEIAEGTTYLSLEGIESGGTIRGAKSVDEGEIASSKFKFTDKHLLYGKLRPYLAKISCPDFSGVCSTDILPILPGPELDRRFLCYFLRQPSMVAYASSRAVGINLPRIAPSTLAEIELPLPPLAEQRRIAKILDNADTLRAQRRAALTKLDAFTQSIFVDLFGHPAVNPKGWRTLRLGDVAEIGTGSTPSRTNGENFGGNTPWVKTTEVDWGLITDTEEKITKQGLQSARCKLHPIGSIVVALYGQGKTRGKTAVLGIEAATNQACGILRPSKKYDTSFLFQQLKLSYQRLRNLGRGGNQENLNLGLLSNFIILLPPISLQREFARRVAAVEKLKTAQRASASEMDALFASLQHRAFQGQL